jgi:hypothetical protein
VFRRLLLFFCLPGLLSASTCTAQCDGTCPPVQLAPIAGRILNAADGSPIVGAIVHYRGLGNTWNARNEVLNPTTLQGEVKTAADGSYALPLLPGGTFIVRASAPGFFAASNHLSEHMAGFKLPPGFSRPSPDMQLWPDVLNIHPLSVEAQEMLRPSVAGLFARNFPVAAFSPDGDRLAFVTFDSVTLHKVTNYVDPPFRRCAAWVYDLSQSKLTAIQSSLPQAMCMDAELRMAWGGDAAYVYPTGLNPSPGEETWRIEGRDAMAWNGPMPKEVIARRALEKSDAESMLKAASDNGSVLASQTTADGRFTLHALDCEGRCTCTTLEVVSAQTHKAKTLPRGCTNNDYMLDRDHDVLYYIDVPGNSSDTPRRFAYLIEYTLSTSRGRLFPLPMMNEEPQLLAFQPLPGGAVRIAYHINGDCDPRASDYTQPGVPAIELGPTPNQYSVCLATVPPQPAGK